jgi:hypothetical protein
VELKIGVKGSPRELMVDTDLSGDDIAAKLAEALAADHGVLDLTDTKGRRVIVPADKVAYVELGDPTGRPVGFGAM